MIVMTAEGPIEIRLPSRPICFRTLCPDAFRYYRSTLLRLIESVSETDDIRRAALDQLLEADKALWPNQLANSLYPSVVSLGGQTAIFYKFRRGMRQVI